MSEDRGDDATTDGDGGGRNEIYGCRYIDPLLGKYIEMTRPEVPNSRLQQYVLTEAGRKMLEGLE